WGWVWYPGYEWAPAWVSWRYGDDWVAWVPLAPDFHPWFRVTVVPTQYWVAVHHRDFTRHRIYQARIRHTRYRHMFARSPHVHTYRHGYRSRLEPRVIERASGRRIERRALPE